MSIQLVKSQILVHLNFPPVQTFNDRHRRIRLTHLKMYQCYGRSQRSGHFSPIIIIEGVT